MSGRRVKALRREFKKVHGREPRKAQFRSTKTGEVQAAPPVKRSTWKDGIRLASKIVELFLRPVFTVTITEPSEWRRWKKAYRR